MPYMETYIYHEAKWLTIKRFGIIIVSVTACNWRVLRDNGCDNYIYLKTRLDFGSKMSSYVDRYTRKSADFYYFYDRS